MTSEILAAHPDAYRAGLLAVGLPNGPKVHPSAPYKAAPDDVEEAAKVVARAEASAAANISAQRIEEVRAQCVADTAELIAGVYPRIA
jgi:hypothetical protein